MRIPEKTVLAASAALLILSTMHTAVTVLDGDMLRQVQALAATHPHSDSFALGFESGVTVIFAIKLLCGLALAGMLLQRMRRRAGDR